MGLVWLTCSLLLWRANWKLASAWFANDSVFNLIMHTLVLCWGCIIIVTFLLGLGEVLTGGTLLSASVGVSAAISGGLRFWGVERAPAPTNVSAGTRFWHGFWLTVLNLWIAHVITSGLLKFPTDWDTLHYHLPLIVHWAQAGSLFAPDNCLWSFPGNNEVLGLWFIAPFSGDFLIGLNNLPVAILLACASIEVGKNLGLSDSLAHWTSFGVVSNYIVLNQLLDASNDIGVAALFLAAVAYGMRLVRRDSPSVCNEILFGVAIGLLVGMKFYALGYAASAAFTIVVLAWKCYGWQRAARLAAVASIGAVAFGGYWYLRNFWMTGSALYPKSFEPVTDLIGKIYPDIGNTSFTGNARPELYALAVEAVWHMCGPLHTAAFVLTPLTWCWFLGMTCFGTTKNRTDSNDIRWVFAGLFALSAAVILSTPFAVEDAPGTLNQMHWHYCPVRYGMCFLSLAVLGLAVVLQDFVAYAPKLALLPHGVVLLGALYQLAFVDRRLPLEIAEVLLIAGNLIFLLGNVWVLAKLWPPLARPLVVALFVVGMGGAAWGIDRLAHRWHGGFTPFYDRTIAGGTYSDLSSATQAGSICVLHHRAYPYFGSRRQHRVCQPVYVPSSYWLMNYLKERQVTLVATKPNAKLEGWHLFEHFDECLRDHPDDFRCWNVNRPLRVFEYKTTDHGENGKIRE
jgi:hypothetical protein